MPLVASADESTNKKSSEGEEYLLKIKKIPMPNRAFRKRKPRHVANEERDQMKDQILHGMLLARLRRLRQQALVS